LFCSNIKETRLFYLHTDTAIDGTVSPTSLLIKTLGKYFFKRLKTRCLFKSKKSVKKRFFI